MGQSSELHLLMKKAILLAGLFLTSFSWSANQSVYNYCTGCPDYIGSGSGGGGGPNGSINNGNIYQTPYYSLGTSSNVLSASSDVMQFPSSVTIMGARPIISTETLQSGTTIYVSSGTVAGQLIAGTLNATTVNVGALPYPLTTASSPGCNINGVVSPGCGNSTKALEFLGSLNSSWLDTAGTLGLGGTGPFRLNVIATPGAFGIRGAYIGTSQVFPLSSVAFMEVSASTDATYALLISTIARNNAGYFIGITTMTEISLNGSVGANGQVLTSAGTGLTPTWTTPSASSGSFTGLNSSGNPLLTSSATFLAGTNITLSQAGSTITINSSATGSGIVSPGTFTWTNNFGIFLSTVQVSSNTILSGATFYGGGPAIIHGTTFNSDGSVGIGTNNSIGAQSLEVLGLISGDNGIEGFGYDTFTRPYKQDSQLVPALDMETSGANDGIVENDGTGIWDLGYSPSYATLGTPVFKWTSANQVIGPSNSFVATPSSFSVNSNLVISSGVLASGSAGTSGQFLQSNGAGTAPTWGTASGSGGASTLAVTTGTTAGFGWAGSSPTAAIVADGTHFSVSLQGGATAYLTLLSTQTFSSMTIVNMLNAGSGSFYSTVPNGQEVVVLSTNGIPVATISNTTVTAGDFLLTISPVPGTGAVPLAQRLMTVDTSGNVIVAGSMTVVSQSVFQGNVFVSTSLVDGLGSVGTSGFVLSSQGQGQPVKWVAQTAGGGGGNPLAISSGSATNSVIVSSPTVNVIFDSNTISVALQGTTSSYVSLTSSVTKQGVITAASLGALTANQTITLSGDSTGSGTTAITVTAAKAQPNINTFTASSMTITGNLLVNGSQTFSNQQFVNFSTSAAGIAAGTIIAASGQTLNVSVTSNTVDVAGYSSCNITATTPYTAGLVTHVPCGLGLVADLAASQVSAIGLEGRTNVLGKAPQYVGTQGHATHYDTGAGSTTTMVGLDSQVEIFGNSSGSTVESSGTAISLLLRAKNGKGAPGHSYSALGLDTDPYIFGGPMFVGAPLTNVPFGVPFNIQYSTPLQNLQVFGNMVLRNDIDTFGLNNSYFLYNTQQSTFGVTMNGSWGTTDFAWTLGFNSVDSHYESLNVIPNAYDWAVATHVNGSSPTGQSSFSNVLQINGATALTQVVGAGGLQVISTMTIGTSASLPASLGVVATGTPNILYLSTSTTGPAMVTVSSTPAINPTDFLLNISSASGTMVLGVTNGGMLVSSGTIPTAGTCGTSPSIGAGSTNVAGNISWSGAATSCAINFSRTLSAAPVECQLTDSGSGFPELGALSASGMTVTLSASVTGGTLYWFCMCGQGGC